jgi:TM2 domain-containing membrane protein YozV
MSDELSPTETPRAAALPGAEPARPAKSPAIAAALTFLFPGVGQIYNGQTTKALVFFGTFVGVVWLCAEGEAMPFAFGIPFVFFFSLIDAYRSAILINARRAGAPLETGEEPASPAWGWALIGLGVVLLLNNLGLWDLWSIRRFWPLVLVVGGIFVIRGAMKRSGADSGTGSGA